MYNNKIYFKTYPDQAYFANPNHEDSLDEVYFGETMTSLPFV